MIHYNFNKTFTGKIRVDIFKRCWDLFYELSDTTPEDHRYQINAPTLNINSNHARYLDYYESFKQIIENFSTLSNFYIRSIDSNPSIILFGMHISNTGTQITFNTNDFQFYHKFSKELKNIYKEDHFFKVIKSPYKIRHEMDEWFKKNQSLISISMIGVMLLTLYFSAKK